MNKEHYVYKITNIINGMFYIGKHSTNNINDGYMGSGTLIELAIEKYGLSAFNKEILFKFDNETDAYKKEAELVPEISCNQYNSICYNLKPGGIYSILTNEIKKKIAISVSKVTKGELNPMFGKKLKDTMSEEAYKKWLEKQSAFKGSAIYNNGINEVRIKKDELPPDGFVKGRLKSSTEKMIKSNIGKKIDPKSIRKTIETKRKNGTLKRSKESIEKQFKTRKERGISSNTTGGKIWINNGKINKFHDPNIPLPDGFKLGRLTKNCHWYTNGIDNRQFHISDSIPEGYYLGRTIIK